MSRRAGIKAASEATGISEWELRQGAKSGKYPAYRVGGPHGRWIFDLDLLEERLKELMMQNMKPYGDENIVGYGALRRIKP